MDTWNGVDRGRYLPRLPVYYRDSLQLAVLSNAERGINLSDEFVIEEYALLRKNTNTNNTTSNVKQTSLARTSTAILSLNNDIIKLNNSLHGRIFKQLDIEDDLDMMNNQLNSFPFIQCWYDLRSIRNYEFYEIDKKTKTDYAHIMSNFLQSQYLIWNNKFSFVSLLNNDCDSAFQMIAAIRRSQRLDRLLFHYNSQGIFNEVLFEGSRSDPPCFFLSCSGLTNNLNVNQPQKNDEETSVKLKNIDLFAPQNTHFSAVDLDKFLTQLSSPNIVVFDSSYSGAFVDHLEKKNDWTNFGEVIVMASCGRAQELPVFSQKIPSDLFTSCLTTPIKTAIFHYQHKLFNETDTHEYITGARLRNYLQKSHFFSFGPRSCCSLFQMVSGSLSDRNTMLGQLNWILIAVTDSIAYSTLDYNQFRVLFRSDLFLASMMRNFIFSCYLLRHFLLRPQIFVSSGVSIFDKEENLLVFKESEFYDKVVNHSLWACWEYHLNFMLQQIPTTTPVDYINDVVIFGAATTTNNNNRPSPNVINKRNSSGNNFEDSSFFMDFLHSFSNYIDHCNGLFNKNHQMDNSSDFYLTILLQSLLGQKFRFDSIKVLTKYFDMSPSNHHCVVNSLRVGFFPYLQKMINILLSKMEYSEMDGFAVFLWSKLVRHYPEYVTVDCSDYKLLYSLENFYFHLLDIFYKKIFSFCGAFTSVSPSFKEYQLLLFFFILTRHLGNIYSDGAAYKQEQLQRICNIIFTERLLVYLKKFFLLTVQCVNGGCKDKMYTFLHLFMFVYHLAMCNVYFYSRNDNKLAFLSEQICQLRHDVNMHLLHSVLNFYANNSIEIYFAVDFTFLSIDLDESSQFITSADKKILIENLHLVHFNMHVNVRNEIIMGILKICIKHLKKIVQLTEFFFDIYSRQLANMIYYSNKNHNNYNITSANQLFNANANIFNLNLNKARRFKIFHHLSDEQLIPKNDNSYGENYASPNFIGNVQTIAFLFEKLFFQTDMVFEEANFCQSMDDSCLLLLSFRYLIGLILIEGSNDVENFNFLNIFINPILSKYTYTNAHTAPINMHLPHRIMPNSANTVTVSQYRNFSNLFTNNSDAKRLRSKPFNSSNSPNMKNVLNLGNLTNLDAASVNDVNTSTHSLNKKRFTISSFFGAISKKSSIDPYIKSVNQLESTSVATNTENESNEMFYFESHESGALVNVNEYIDILNSEIKEQINYKKPINFKMRINMENNLLLFRTDLSEKINNIFEQQSSMTYMSTVLNINNNNKNFSTDNANCLFNSYQDMGFTKINKYEQNICSANKNNFDYLFEQKNLNNVVYKSNNNKTFVKFHDYEKSCYVFNGDQLTVHDLSEKKNNYTCKINRSVLESTSVVDMFMVNSHVKFCDSDHGTIGYATSDGIVRIVKLKNGDSSTTNNVKCLSWFRAGYPMKNVTSLEAFAGMQKSNDYPMVMTNFDQYTGTITTLCGCDDRIRLFDVNRGVQVEQIDLKNSNVFYTSMVNMSTNEFYIGNSNGEVLRVDRRENNQVSEIMTEAKFNNRKKKLFGIKKCNEEFYTQCDQTLNLIDDSLNSYVFDVRCDRVVFCKRVNKKFSTQIDGLNSVRLYNRSSVCDGCRDAYNSSYAYIDSKTGNVYFAGEEATRRLATQHSRVQMRNQDKSRVTVHSFDFHHNYNMMALGYSNGMVEFISQKG